MFTMYSFTTKHTNSSDALISLTDAYEGIRRKMHRAKGTSSSQKTILTHFTQFYVPKSHVLLLTGLEHIKYQMVPRAENSQRSQAKKTAWLVQLMSPKGRRKQQMKTSKQNQGRADCSERHPERMQFSLKCLPFPP